MVDEFEMTFMRLIDKMVNRVRNEGIRTGCIWNACRMIERISLVWDGRDPWGVLLWDAGEINLLNWVESHEYWCYLFAYQIW